MLKYIFKNSITSFHLLSKYQISIDKIRNFCIIAHIDHGKSTLADRFLEITGTISKGKHEQYLDKLEVEKERGITVKAQSAAMFYKVDGIEYLYNLIDTPGHVDFTYEVSRSMRACEGAILLIDATQGIQAQTLSNYILAKKQNLKIIPVINKIDMTSANTESVIQQLVEKFDMNPNEIFKVSAKKGTGVTELLNNIVTLIPPPQDHKELKCFLIDSWYARDKGVVLLILMKGGYLKKGDQILSCAFKKKYDVFEVGIQSPENVPQEKLEPGQVGYVMTNMKAANEARIGDTFRHPLSKTLPETGFEQVKPLVYCGIYPEDPDDYAELNKSIFKLALTDPAVIIQKESSAALGNGYRCGFLGVLHMDVFRERLENEYNLSVLLTSPSVPYKAILRNGKEVMVENAIMAPDAAVIKHYEQPMAIATIMCPEEYSATIFQLCDARNGRLVDQEKYDKQDRYTFKFPLNEIIQDLFDKIKSATKGYGSLEYEFCGFEKANIVKLVIHLMDDPVDALSFMVPEERAHQLGKKICQRLKDNIPQHLFVVSIQAKVGGKVIAAEKIGSTGKNVTAKCYGGDYTRKKKLLDRQKEGKKRMREVGRVTVRKDTFISVFKDD
ncbi:unnamed protein product [Paramecium octaurelia]|uniref:Translation factor GUF1 homolog, mitochondrial n=1 Tax=Paramecium octaurelia TaxID=43137 RepID=A0A8S1ULT5_PAROT|nr:unnamed protein product [Paramecium octaurelia]